MPMGDAPQGCDLRVLRGNATGQYKCCVGVFDVWAGLFHGNALGNFQLDTAVFAAGIIIISGIEWLKLTIPSSG